MLLFLESKFCKEMFNGISEASHSPCNRKGHWDVHPPLWPGLLPFLIFLPFPTLFLCLLFLTRRWDRAKGMTLGNYPGRESGHALGRGPGQRSGQSLEYGPRVKDCHHFPPSVNPFLTYTHTYEVHEHIHIHVNGGEDHHGFALSCQRSSPREIIEDYSSMKDTNPDWFSSCSITLYLLKGHSCYSQISPVPKMTSMQWLSKQQHRLTRPSQGKNYVNLVCHPECNTVLFIKDRPPSRVEG